MKKFTKIMALTLVAVMLCATLVSCGKVMGAYEAEVDLGFGSSKVVYEFGLLGKVTISVTNELLGSSKTETYEGKYEITEKNDGKMEITFSFESEDAKSYNSTSDFEIDKENNTIKIGLFTYKKVEK